MMVTVWDFLGIECALIMSSRAKNKKDIRGATLLALLLVIIITSSLSLLSLGIMPTNTIAHLHTPSTTGVLEHCLPSIAGIISIADFIRIAIIICVLGAFQVSATGDLANWHTGTADAIPAVGGAMDLAVGAKQTWVMMDLLNKNGKSKIVEKCEYPLTGIGCVSRIYTDLATFECTARGLKLVETVQGLGLEELRALLGGLPLLQSE